jgi:hypothetical protein
MQSDSLYLIHNEQILDSQTGELLTEEDFHGIFSEELSNKISEYKKACRDIGELPQLGINKLQGVVYAVVPIKNKHKFNKVFEVDMRELILKGKTLTTNEFAFIGCFTSFITFPTNEIKVNNEYLTFEEIGKMIGIGKNAVSTMLKNLEKNEVIKIVKRHKLPPIIYFNPFLNCGGKVVEYETYMLFRDSIFNPNKLIDDIDK